LWKVVERKRIHHGRAEKQERNIEWHLELVMQLLLDVEHCLANLARHYLGLTVEKLELEIERAMNVGLFTVAWW
jgi:hypothetical protein